MTHIILEVTPYGVLSIDSERFDMPDFAGTGKTLKQLIIEDPVKMGYPKEHIEKFSTWTQAEKDSAKSKAKTKQEMGLK